MHSTKTEILAHLKRNDGSTVDGIASSLNLAPMTVRQHLMALERDGAVRAEGVRRPTGRPHFRYLLTDDGHRRLSDGYDRLLALLVDQAGLTSGDPGTPHERRNRLFRMAAQALAERHRDELRGLGLAAQAERAVAILRAHGGFAEFHAGPGEVEIRDFGCVYHETIGPAAPCAWHEPFLVALLDAEVQVEHDAPTGCAMCCRYTVRARVSVAATDRGRVL
jgi:predicted ArsR family transcriptional regulator